MANVDSDIKKIEKLIALMKENDLVEIEIAHGEDKMCLKRQQFPSTTLTGMPLMGSPAAIPEGIANTSPSVDDQATATPNAPSALTAH